MLNVYGNGKKYVILNSFSLYHLVNTKFFIKGSEKSVQE